MAMCTGYRSNPKFSNSCRNCAKITSGQQSWFVNPSKIESLGNLLIELATNQAILPIDD